MKKSFISILIAVILIFNITASADNADISIAETETGLSVSFTAPESGGIYVIGTEYNETTLQRTVVRHIDNAVSGEDYTAELTGFYGGSIYIWNDDLKPLFGKTDYADNRPENDGIIHLLGDKIYADGVEGAVVDGTAVTITAAGDYIIEGTLDDGQIVVSDALGKKDEVNIEFRGVNVTCSDSAPFNAGGGKIGITLADGTTNIFTDTSAYTNYTTSKDPKGCFYSRRDLDIGGAGTLKVNGNVKNGLVCGADMKIKKGANLDVTAVNNAIKGDNGVEFTDKTGTVKITSTGGDGVKSDAIDTDIVPTGAIEADKGYVTIAGGTFSITAAGDGIQADNYCTITGGNITINSGAEGVKANEVNLPVIADDAVVENQFVNGKIAISGGTLDITSGEDGIKAAESVTVSDASDITVTATGTDAADNSGYDGIQAGETAEAVSGNVTTETVTVAGTVTISGGAVDITASDDAVKTSGGFVMTGGTLTGSAGGDFIKAYELVDIDAGMIDAAAKFDGIQSGKALVEATSGTTVTKSDYTTGNIDISGGNITLVTNGGHGTVISDDADSCKGIKANTELNINGGTFNIDSADDSIHSNWNVTVTGGGFTLATGDDGVHADNTLTLGTENGSDDDFSIDITTSYEGIEGSVIKMLSGTTYLVASDDGINAAGDYQEGAALSSINGIELIAGPGGPGGNPGGGPGSGPGGNPGGGTGGWGPGWGSDDSAPYGMLYIKGGRCYVEANGDGVDSNGSIEMSGGAVIENGPTSGGNGVFDIGDSNGCYFRITGGTLIGAGTSDMPVTPTVSGQSYALTGGSGGMGGRPGQGGGGSSGSAGTPVQITTADGTFTFVPKTSWNWMFVTMPEMTSGGSYTITANSGSASGTQIFGKTVNNTFYGLIKND